MIGLEDEGSVIQEVLEEADPIKNAVALRTDQFSCAPTSALL